MTHPTRRLLALTLLAFGALATARAAEPLRIAHARGETLVQATPQRVAVYDLAALDILQALGVPVAGVPQAAFPAYLSAHADAAPARIGSLFEPDYDALAKLAPDLIVVSGRSRAAYDKLSALAPTLDLSTGTADFSGDVLRNIDTLGRVFGKPEAAAALAARLRAALRDLQAKGARQGSGVVLFAVNGNVNAQAPGSRFGIVHQVTGVAAVLPPAEATAEAAPRAQPGSPEAAAQRQRQQALLETALQAQPRWLFVLDRDAATGGEPRAAETLAAHPLVAASSAWRAGRVIYLDAPGWYLVGAGAGILQQEAARIGGIFDAAER